MPDEDDPRDALSCFDCVNAIFYCMSPRNQSRSYYREGKFDRCEQQFADLSFCTKLKTVSKAKALEMLKELAKEQPSPTLGSIWRERGTDEPGF